MAARGNRDDARDRHEGRASARPRRPAAARHRAARRGVAPAPADRPHRPLLRAPDDEDDAAEETLDAFDALVRDGQGPPRRRVELHRARGSTRRSSSQRATGSRRFVALQPHYNLVERDEYEGELRRPLRRATGSALLPYFGLARGFLTGKYRAGGARSTARAPAAPPPTSTSAASTCSTPSRTVAAAHGVRRAAVALAWLAPAPTVVAPIASARTPEQLADLLRDGGARARRGRAGGA